MRFPNHLVFRLCRKHAEAVKAARDSKDDFSRLNGSVDPPLVRKWADEEAEALRARDLNEASMDIFDIKICKGPWFQIHILWLERLLSKLTGPSQAELQLNLLEKEQTSSMRKGSINVLAQGLKIEESQ